MMMMRIASTIGSGGGSTWRQTAAAAISITVSCSPRTSTAASTTTTTPTNHTFLSKRYYISRAHPKPTPVYGIQTALQLVLQDIAQRKIKRAENHERFRGQKEKRGVKIEGPYRNLDETVEFMVNLNVDPRKPGQMLRGSIALPHGSGKRFNCIVFTNDTDLEKQALAMGAKYAGGMELIDDIVKGNIPLESLQRSLATPNMVTYLSKVARILGPRGLMPNAKVGTLLADHLILDALKTELAGQQAQYRTEKEGIVQLGIGKGSFAMTQLLDNIRAVMEELMNNSKPETYGKGKKKTSTKAPPKRGDANAGKKYLMRSHVTSTFGDSYRVDLRTIDPSNMYYLAPLPTDPIITTITTTTTTTTTSTTTSSNRSIIAPTADLLESSINDGNSESGINDGNSESGMNNGNSESNTNESSIIMQQ